MGASQAIISPAANTWPEPVNARSSVSEFQAMPPVDEIAFVNGSVPGTRRGTALRYAARSVGLFGARPNSLARVFAAGER